MSNVLIGIIGVILFIGLALAGALILGDDFRSSRATTTAATVSSHMQQLANGITMYNMKTGRSFMTDTSRSALIPRFVKLVPVNPFNPVNPYNFGNGNGSIPPGVPVKEIWTVLGPQNDQGARDACLAIEQTAGNQNAEVVVDNPTNYRDRVNTVERVGCIMDRDNNSYTAYIRI